VKSKESVQSIHEVHIEKLCYYSVHVHKLLSNKKNHRLQNESRPDGYHTGSFPGFARMTAALLEI